MDNPMNEQTQKWLDKAVLCEEKMLDAGSDEEREKQRKHANMAFRAAVRSEIGTNEGIGDVI